MSAGTDSVKKSGDILKKASYALCFGSSESGKFIKYQNIAAQDAHWYVNNVRA